MMQETFSFTVLLHSDIMYKVRIKNKKIPSTFQVMCKKTCDEPCRYIEEMDLRTLPKLSTKTPGVKQRTVSSQQEMTM